MINKYIYAHLPDGVLEQLRRLNPPINGYRRHKHFQHLTQNTGNPHLDRQIVAVTTLMRAARSKAMFDTLFRQAFPARGDQLDLGVDVDQDEEEVAPLPQPTASAAGMTMENVRGAYTHEILRALGAYKRLSARELSKVVYSDETERTQAKVRGILNRLKNAGTVRPGDDGRWELCGDAATK